MPVTVTERFFDPNDPDRPWRNLSAPSAVDVEESPWVAPDYSSIPGDADIPSDQHERRLVWPGPALVMPAGLLPDGKPYSRNEWDNAERINGTRPLNDAEADAVVVAYMLQQNALRESLGIPRARRSGGKHEDPPEALEMIRRLHEQERRRRRAAG